MDDRHRLPARSHCRQTYPGDAQRPDVLAVGGGAVPRTPGPRQQTAKTLNADATVDSMPRRGWGPHQPGTGIVIAY